MADSIKFAIDAAIGVFQNNIAESYNTMAQAATKAVRDVGISARNSVRANMRSVGFPSRWANSVGARFTPSAGQAPSIDASVKIHSSINFLGVFEQGSRIGGKPLLWLPLPDIPAKIGGQPMRPALFVANFGPLRSARNSPIPLLVAQVAVTQGGRVLKKTGRNFKLGAGGTRAAAWVPVFVGITAVQLHKRLGFVEILAQAQNTLPEVYAEYMTKLLA